LFGVLSVLFTPLIIDSLFRAEGPLPLFGVADLQPAGRGGVASDPRAALRLPWANE